jgi:hypothetical protein
MFKFLLVMFLLDPASGQMEVVKLPQVSMEVCQQEAREYASAADSLGYGMLATCVKPEDYESDS